MQFTNALGLGKVLWNGRYNIIRIFNYIVNVVNIKIFLILYCSHDRKSIIALSLAFSFIFPTYDSTALAFSFIFPDNNSAALAFLFELKGWQNITPECIAL